MPFSFASTAPVVLISTATSSRSRAMEIRHSGDCIYGESRCFRRKYFVSFDAQRFCQLGTLTGSIGVIMTSPSAVCWRSARDYVDGYRTFESAKIFDPLAESRNVKNTSTRRSTGSTLTLSPRRSRRDMEVKEFEALAKGRVWTGRAAKERNLIDAIGGYEAAIQETWPVLERPRRQPAFTSTHVPRHRSSSS